MTSNFGDGNTFFTRMSGCNAYFCTESDYYALGRLELMDQAVQHIRYVQTDLYFTNTINIFTVHSV